MRRTSLPGKDGRATLATVAASAGVSIATVSKVLNGRNDVAPGTRALIETLLDEHGYVARRADPASRGTAGTAPTIELVIHGPFTAYCMEVLQGVLDAGAQAGVAVSVSARERGEHTGRGRPAAWARSLVSAGRRAVIAVVNELTVAELSALSRARLPMVVIDPLNLPRARVTSVGSTNFAGGLAATQHLLSLGHRRIGYIGGPPAAACNQARMHGYRAAMEAAGVRVPKTYVRHGHFRYEDGVEHGSALLDLRQAPTSVFAGNDEIAAGVIEAARARGLRVPEDLSVVGFDDTHVARLASPQLTTVRQPLREMGSVALRTAIRLAAGERLESHHVELATTLVVRASTAPPMP